MKLLSLYSIVIRLLCAMPLIAASPIIGDAAITVAPLEKRVPAAVYGPGKFGAFSSGNPFISFDNNVRFYLQNTDANLVV